MWQAAKVFLRRIREFTQGILENKTSEFITAERVATLMSLLFWGISEFYSLPFPNQAILILAAFCLTLGVIHFGMKLWDRRKGTLANPHDPNGEAESQNLDDTLENAEQKERFRLFIQGVMHLACYRMQWMGYQVQGKIFNGPVSTREEWLLHYSVDAYRFFMQSLENREEILRDFLAARESLRNDDFLFAQRLFMDLYAVYEHRRPWLRDMAWETFPNVSTYSVYTDWEKADRDMREELIKLIRDCRVLGDLMADLTLPAPRRWEKGGS